MKWIGRKLPWGLLLPVLLFLPVSSRAEAVYQVTETQLTELETIFSELKTESETQKNLLKEQQTQTAELKKQLETSKAETLLSKDQLKEAQTQLDAAKASLQKSEAKSKATERRLKRQRAIWMVIAGAAIGWGACRT